MKRNKKFFALFLVIAMVFTLTACGSSDTKENKEPDNNNNDDVEDKIESFDDYMGNTYSGKDPFGNKLSITFNSLENEELTWLFKDLVNKDEESFTLSAINTSNVDEGSFTFDVKGVDIENPKTTFEFVGTVTLRKGNLIVNFESGQISNSSKKGGTSFYQLDDVKESEKTVTLTKDNAN